MLRSVLMAFPPSSWRLRRFPIACSLAPQRLMLLLSIHLLVVSFPPTPAGHSISGRGGRRRAFRFMPQSVASRLSMVGLFDPEGGGHRPREASESVEATGDPVGGLDDAVDGFGGSVGGSVGVEVGQDRGLPGAQVRPSRATSGIGQDGKITSVTSSGARQRRRNDAARTAAARVRRTYACSSANGR